MIIKPFKKLFKKYLKKSKKKNTLSSVTTDAVITFNSAGIVAVPREKKSKEFSNDTSDAISEEVSKLVLLGDIILWGEDVWNNLKSPSNGVYTTTMSGMVIGTISATTDNIFKTSTGMIVSFTSSGYSDNISLENFYLSHNDFSITDRDLKNAKIVADAILSRIPELNALILARMEKERIIKIEGFTNSVRNSLS